MKGAKAAAQPMPMMATRQPISLVHKLGSHGLLHAGTLPEAALDRLRHECSRTSCDWIHDDATQLFDPETLSVLKQGCHTQPAAVMKLVDGFVLYVPNEGNRVLSVMKDSCMCLPHGAHPSEAGPLAPDGSRSVFYSIVIPPGQERRTLPFKLVFHNGFNATHEISRFAPAEHAIAQIAMAIPQDPEQQMPRVMMQSGLLGSLMGQCLSGEKAFMVKQAFLSLVSQSGDNPSGVYDTPIEMSEMLANMLQLKNKKGQISLGRCADGVFGYRRRKDNKNSFVFVTSCDDFNCNAPSPTSSLQVFKMCYKDATPNGLRIFIKIGRGSQQQQQEPEEDNERGLVPGCPYRTPYIIPGKHTVADVISIVQHLMRNSNLESMGCGDFPRYCHEAAMERMQSGGPENELMQMAAHSLLHLDAPHMPGAITTTTTTMQRQRRNGG